MILLGGNLSLGLDHGDPFQSSQQLLLFKQPSTEVMADKKQLFIQIIFYILTSCNYYRTIMALRTSTSSRLVELQDINPDDVAVRTRTITTNIQSPPQTITTTTTKKVVGHEQGNEMGMFGLNTSGVHQRTNTAGNFIEGNQIITAYNQHPVGYASRENITFTVPPIAQRGQTQTYSAHNYTLSGNIPGQMGVLESERMMATNRGLNPVNLPPTLHPEGAMYPLENYSCLYNCCPFELCKCVQCSDMCMRCCGASCFTESIGAPVRSCCSGCCTPRIPGMGMGIGTGGGMNTGMGGYGNYQRRGGCFSCCCPQRQYPSPIMSGGPGFQGNMTPPGFIPPVGLNGATTTSIGAGLPPMGAMNNQAMFSGPMNPGFGMGGMGTRMGPGIPGQDYQFQGRGIFGNCCGCQGDWCSTNFGQGQNCCGTCPALRKCCC